MSDRVAFLALLGAWLLSAFGVALPGLNDSVAERASLWAAYLLPIAALLLAVSIAVREEHGARLASLGRRRDKRAARVERAQAAELTRNASANLGFRTQLKDAKAELATAQARIAALEKRTWTADERLQALRASLDRLMEGSREFAWNQALGTEHANEFTRAVKAMLTHVLTLKASSAERMSFDDACCRVPPFLDEGGQTAHTYSRNVGRVAHDWLMGFRERVTAEAMRQNIPPLGESPDA